MRKTIGLALVLATIALPALAFLEDLCLPRRGRQGPLSWCVAPNCLGPDNNVNRACIRQMANFAFIQPGRSMVHMDATHFLAQALGYRADVAYWIAAYNEVTDYGVYKPIDQCGQVASTTNTGKNFISATFDGFVRTNTATDGPLDHYIVNFSPAGTGTDVHGAGGVQALYPFYYPRPGYPVRIDTTYQKTLANLRQWAMIPTTDPGLLCTVGLVNGDQCQTGGFIVGAVPLIQGLQAGVPMNIPLGKKVLDSSGSTPVYYEALQSYLDNPQQTTGTLWLGNPQVPVPVQVARFGIYLHTLQDASSHATFCGDDAPSVPGGRNPGTYMYQSGANVQLSFGNGCATGPHLASHVQETGTGSNALPLRDYVALMNTIDELIVFGNEVARKQQGWIVNPELLPPDTVGGKNAQGMSAADLKTELVGKLMPGPAPYSRAEVYQSAIVTLPLQQTNTMDRLSAMNQALANYSSTVRARSKNPSAFTPFQQAPGNAADVNDTSGCWTNLPTTTTALATARSPRD